MKLANQLIPLAFLLSLSLFGPPKIGGESIGVCNGRLGNNLPTNSEVISLYQSNGISKMRIYDPNPSILETLKGSNIELYLDIPRGTIQPFTDPSYASNWVQSTILNFPDVNFKYISVGNEIDPDEQDAQFIYPAIQNIQSAINRVNLLHQIKVSTTIKMSSLKISYPPSQGSFSEMTTPFIAPIIAFLAQNGSPLLVNVYPFFAAAADDLDYSLFKSPGVVVNDGPFGYQNMFDAMVDAVYSAVERVGGSGVEIVVGESGWPSDGGGHNGVATAENAGIYYRKLIEHVKSNAGTPKRPGKSLEVYLFAMFDENEKDGDATERHFGIFSHDKTPKYQLNFN